MPMGRNSFLEDLNHSQTSVSALAAVPSNAFMAYPLVLCPAFGGMQPGWQQALYQIAFERAQAAVRRPTLFERDWLGVWN
jgi:hypothetical protein